MKVLHFINSLAAGGAEKLLVDSLLSYSQKGINVDILLINKDESPFIEKLNIDKSIKIHNLGKNINVYNPKWIFKLNSYFKNYDLVHVHLFPSSYWAGISKLFNRTKYKSVFTEHNTTNRRRNSRIFKFIDKIIYKQFDKIISISDSVDETLRSHLENNSNFIQKIYNGINLEEINNAAGYSKKELGFVEDDILIMQVSSFTSQKDQATLIKAMENLDKRFKLLLVGDGPEIEECKNLAISLNLSETISFLGVRKDVPRLLKTVDVAVLSSKFEGLSLSSVEALQSGKPFVASNVPGLTEVVEGAGVLFEQGNEKELSAILLKLISNKTLYDSISTSCLARAKDFELSNMTDKYIELYEKLLK